MAELEVQSGSAQIITFTPAGVNGDTFINDGQTIIQAAGPPTGWQVIVANGQPCSFSTDPDDHPPYTIDVPAGIAVLESERLDPRRFNDNTGRVSISYSDPVGIQVAIVRLDMQSEDP